MWKGSSGSTFRGREVIYLDDRLIGHPKLIQAGQLVGRNGVSRALHLYLVGLVHARKYLTNGFVSAQVVADCRTVESPLRVAGCLCSEQVLLWHRQPGGYQIHDFLKYNKTAEEVKHQQQVTRDRVAKWRALHPRLTNGGNGGL